jgi:multiple sugar transport system ATP-binding protein
MSFVDGELDAMGRFAAEGLALQTAPGCCAPAGEPRRAVLGVRPEHLCLEAGPLLGEVSLVEPMGSHQIVWLRCAGHTLAALDHDARAFVPGQRVGFGIDAARVSLFDPESGVRL